MACKMIVAVLAALMSTVSLVNSQQAPAGPNTLAQYNPSNRTMSSNATWLIVPVQTALVQSLVPYPLLSMPQDTSLFPQGFPPGYHPVIFAAGYANDIRMIILNLLPAQIASLMQADIIVPYTDRLKDGKTPFGYPINYYIGSTNGEDVEALVPSLASDVSPFEGTTIFPAEFVPYTAASAYVGSGLYSAQVKPYILPNAVSGPGVVLNAFDVLYAVSPNSPPVYTPHTFHALLNQPQILNEGMCQRNTLYFNASFAAPQFVLANLTVSGTTVAGITLPNSPPPSLAGDYDGVTGYAANAEIVAGGQEACSVSPGLVPADATN